MDAIWDLLSQFWLALQQGQIPALGFWTYLVLMVMIVIQGPISTMLGGAAAAAGLVSPFGVLLAAVVGNLLADTFWYLVGFSNQVLLDRWLHRSRRVVGLLQREMERHGLKILFLGKLSIGLAVPAVIAAGLAHISWRKWVPTVVAGEVGWSGVMLLIGFFATEAIGGAQRTIGYLAIALTAGLMAVIVLYLRRRLREMLDAA